MTVETRNIQRVFSYEDVTIASGAAESDEISVTRYAGGIVRVCTEWTDANIGILHSHISSGTFNVLHDYLGSPVQISGIPTTGGGDFALPDEVFAAGYVKLWSKSTTAATETDTNQGDARSLTVVLKG